jgi:hypothetical protein
VFSSFTCKIVASFSAPLPNQPVGSAAAGLTLTNNLPVPEVTSGEPAGSRFPLWLRGGSGGLGMMRDFPFWVTALHCYYVGVLNGEGGEGGNWDW